MPDTFEAFAAAIVGQESGGNYRAVNRSSGALGKYQIMEANVGPWSREVLGRTVTPTEFLNTPALQDQIARGKLRQYYERYGARGAASAWYSGNPALHESTRPQPGGPSIKGYVDAVIARMGAGAGAAVVPAEGPGLNPLEGLEDALGGSGEGLATTLAEALGDLAWRVGRPVLVTVTLVSAGAALVVLGAWRAAQDARGRRR